MVAAASTLDDEDPALQASDSEITSDDVPVPVEAIRPRLADRGSDTDTASSADPAAPEAELAETAEEEAPVLDGPVLRAPVKVASAGALPIVPGAAGATPAKASAGAADPSVVSILLAGDTGFSTNNSPVSPKGVSKGGRFQTFAEAARGIAPLVTRDLNFINVETVVTDRNDLPRDTKGQGGPFNFRTHPLAMRTMVDLGFNVFSLANNHSMDYGVPGLRETLAHVKGLRAAGLLAAAGIGEDRDQASAPEVIALRGRNIAFSAIGIVTNNLERHRAGESKPGQIAYRFADDFALSTGRLAATAADYRMLSIHYGIEGQVRTDGQQIADYRRNAVMRQGIDLVIGHHAHVVRGVERVGDRLIFYGLGNFLHHGTADMSGKGICKDYGLVARVHLAPGSDGRLHMRALEAIPLTAMHIHPVPMAPEKAAQRIHVLNYLASLLDDGQDGAEGVRFTPMPDGTGLFCMPGATDDPEPIASLCAGWKPAPPIPAGLKGSIAASCAR